MKLLTRENQKVNQTFWRFFQFHTWPSPLRGRPTLNAAFPDLEGLGRAGGEATRIFNLNNQVLQF